MKAVCVVGWRAFQRQAWLRVTLLKNLRVFVLWGEQIQPSTRHGHGASRRRRTPAFSWKPLLNAWESKRTRAGFPSRSLRKKPFEWEAAAFFSLPFHGGIFPEGESLGISSPDGSRQSAPCLCQNVNEFFLKRWAVIYGWVRECGVRSLGCRGQSG